MKPQPTQSLVTRKVLVRRLEKQSIGDLRVRQNILASIART